MEIQIPDEALKYFLFQHNARQLFWPKKILRKLLFYRFPSVFKYQNVVAVEASLFKNRTRKAARKDTEGQYREIENYLPAQASRILDIGCGIGLMDALLSRKYPGAEMYLFDRTEVKEGLHYQYRDHASFYNSLDAAKDLLIANGIKEDKIYTHSVNDDFKMDFGRGFDLIIALASWGFHFPVSTYLDQVYDRLKPGGTLIMDIRKDVGGEKEVMDKFGNMEIIAEWSKAVRIRIKKI